MQLSLLLCSTLCDGAFSVMPSSVWGGGPCVAPTPHPWGSTLCPVGLPTFGCIWVPAWPLRGVEEVASTALSV